MSPLSPRPYVSFTASRLPLGLAQGALLLMLLWRTWSIYTWTTNWTGTERVVARFSVSTGLTLV